MQEVWRHILACPNSTVRLLCRKGHSNSLTHHCLMKNCVFWPHPSLPPCSEQTPRLPEDAEPWILLTSASRPMGASLPAPCLRYEEYFRIKRVPYSQPLSQPQHHHFSALDRHSECRCQLCPWGLGQNTANTPSGTHLEQVWQTREWHASPEGFMSLSLSMAGWSCLSPCKWLHASTIHLSLSSGLQSQVFNGHSLGRFSRCLLEGAELNLWTSWRMDEH